MLGVWVGMCEFWTSGKMYLYKHECIVFGIKKKNVLRDPADLDYSFAQI